MNNTIKLGLIGIDTPTARAYTANDFDAELAKCDPAETLYIDLHSEGGSVFEGFRIFNSLKDWGGKKVARVKVAAFSIASYIAMACDEIEIAGNGYFMIHNPYSSTEGDDEAHAKNAKLLSELKESMISEYSARTGMEAEAVKTMMKAESYVGANEAIELGLADRLIESVAKPKKLPKNHLPSLVFAAMYGQQSDDNEPAATPQPEEVIMSSDPTQPVAATVSAIKKAFPKASSDFIVRCMEEEMPMEDVGEEYAKAMEDENEELKAKVTAMEAEIEELKAMAEPEAEEEETPAVPAARRVGAKPIANAGSTQVDPVTAWDSLVQSFVAQGKNRQQAVIAANRANPALRQSLIRASN